MDHVRIDPDAAEAPYEQVRRQIAAAVADGALAPGHRLPTVRQLAADLHVAVNTAARVYRELEADGLIETQGRRGTFVRSSRLDDADARAAARTYVETLRRSGLSRDEAVRLVDEHWTP